MQTFVSALATLSLVLPATLAIIDDELREYLPEGWTRWAIGAAAVVASGSAAVARIMAIPAIDSWLDRLRVSSAPEAPGPGPDRQRGHR